MRRSFVESLRGKPEYTAEDAVRGAGFDVEIYDDGQSFLPGKRPNTIVLWCRNGTVIWSQALNKEELED